MTERIYHDALTICWLKKAIGQDWDYSPALAFSCLGADYDALIMSRQGVLRYETQDPNAP